MLTIIIIEHELLPQVCWIDKTLKNAQGCRQEDGTLREASPCSRCSMSTSNLFDVAEDVQHFLEVCHRTQSVADSFPIDPAGNGS